jgi:ubiquitin-like protein ATG12
MPSHRICQKVVPHLIYLNIYQSIFKFIIWLIYTFFIFKKTKVNVRFLPVGSAPALVRKVFAITASKKFAVVVSFLRKRLGLKDTDSIFVYVNSTFAPALDEEVGNLFKCFRVKDELVVWYCMTPAFG